MKKLFNGNNMKQWLKKFKSIITGKNNDDDYFDHPFAIF